MKEAYNNQPKKASKSNTALLGQSQRKTNLLAKQRVKKFEKSKKSKKLKKIKKRIGKKGRSSEKAVLWSQRQI